MADQARFGLRMLPLSMKEKAVNGETLIDPNTGHIYIKLNGNLISKTVEIEEKLNKLLSDLKYRTTSISFNGSDIKEFASDVTGVVINGNSCKLSQNNIILDKEPILFDVNNYFKYRVIIRYTRNNGGTIGLKFNSNNEVIRPTIVSNSDNDTAITIYDIPISGDVSGVGVFTLTNTLDTTIHSIAIVKSGSVTHSGSPTTLSPNDVNETSNIGTYNINATNDTVHNNDVPYVDCSFISTFKLNNKGLIAGLYSMNLVLLDDAAGVLTIETTNSDDTTFSLDIDLNSLSNANNGVDIQNEMKIATCSILVPPCGIKYITFRTNDGDCKLLNASLIMIPTAVWNSRKY